jgi:predicted dehydrogenase
VSSADAVLAHQGPVHAPWFFDREKAGWGVLADLGIYLISQFTYLFGPAESVCGGVTTVFPERTSEDGETFKATVDDNIAAVITWPNNILGSIHANWCSAADKRNFIWEVRIYGTAGTIFINVASPKNALVVYAPGRGIEGAEKIVRNGMTDCYRPALPAWDHHRYILRSFADAMARDGPIVERGSSPTRQHHVIEIIAKLYESSKTGRAMGLEIKY